jgi:hypothetical protein
MRVPKKWKIDVQYDPANQLMEIHLKKMKSDVKKLSIAKKWQNQTMCLPTHKGNVMHWYIPCETMEYFWVRKKDEILSFITTWMELEIFELINKARPTKTSTTQFHFYMESTKSWSQRSWDRMVICQWLGRGGRGEMEN